jgi:hypothetical protein
VGSQHMRQHRVTEARTVIRGAVSGSATIVSLLQYRRKRSRQCWSDRAAAGAGPAVLLTLAQQH